MHLRSRISRIRCRIFLSLFLRFFNRRSCGSDFNNSRHAVSDTAAKEILLGNLLSVHGNGCVSIYFIYCPLLSLFPLIPRHRLIYGFSSGILQHLLRIASLRPFLYIYPYITESPLPTNVLCYFTRPGKEEDCKAT